MCFNIIYLPEAHQGHQQLMQYHFLNMRIYVCVISFIIYILYIYSQTSIMLFAVQKGPCPIYAVVVTSML